MLAVAIREARSERLQREGMEYVREMFNAVYEWFIDADQPTWQAREWRHYVIVEASADEQYTQYDELEDDDRIDAATFRDMQDDLTDRLSIVRTDVAGSVDGCSASDVGAAEMTALVRQFWSGQSSINTLRDAEDADDEHPTPREAVDDSQVTVSRSEDAIAEDLGIAASHFDAKRGLIELGGQGNSRSRHPTPRRGTDVHETIRTGGDSRTRRHNRNVRTGTLRRRTCCR